MDKQQFSGLYRGYLEDQLSTDELHRFKQISSQQPYDQWLEELLQDTVSNRFTEVETADVDLSQMRNHLLTSVVGIQQKRSPLKYYVAAASLLVFMGTAFYLWFRPASENKRAATEQPAVPDLVPGRELAKLTLGDGSSIVLDSAGRGVLAQQSNAAVTRMADGSIAYKVADYNGAGAETMNTLSTPRGGRFQLVLADGTGVWLNAASSVTFPAAFTGNSRKVEVTGEAYFEVSSDQKHPFIVKVNGGSSVEVLGTSFNVNSYGDEGRITTTLLEGTVRILAGKAVVIKPGQQAVVIAGDAKEGNAPQVVNGADLKKVMAWKNGFFNFDNARLPVVMKQLERWYDIDVKYEGPVPDVVFKGGMDRDVKLTGIIRFFAGFGIRARLEGKTLIISQQ